MFDVEIRLENRVLNVCKHTRACVGLRSKAECFFYKNRRSFLLTSKLKIDDYDDGTTTRFCTIERTVIENFKKNLIFLSYNAYTIMVVFDRLHTVS